MPFKLQERLNTKFKMDVFLIFLSTFRSFEQLDLHDGLQYRSPPPNVQPHYGTSLLQGLHGFAVWDFRDVNLVHSQDAIIDPTRKTKNHRY